jgi:hypothetical protein
MFIYISKKDFNDISGAGVGMMFKFDTETMDNLFFDLEK